MWMLAIAHMNDWISYMGAVLARSLLVGLAVGCLPLAVLPAQSVVVQIVNAMGVPIPYALVDVGRVTGRIADSSGTVRLSGVRGDTLAIRARRMGYVPFQGRVARTDDAHFRVVLDRLPQELERVDVIADRNTPLARSGFYDRMQRVQRGAIVGEFITPEELDQRLASQVSRLLYGRQYVTVVPMGRHTLLAGRGGRCAMTIVVDGVRVNGVIEPPDGRIRQSETRNRLSIDEIVDGNSVAGIEIYPSTANAPAELIPLTGGGSCGIIAIWTGGRH